MLRIMLAITALLLVAMPLAFAQDAASSKMVMPMPYPPPVREPGIISVNGECVRTVTPDRGLVTATATYTDPKSVKKASEFVMKQYEDYNTAVKAMGLNDLVVQTSDYSVSPVYEWVQPDPNKGGKQVLKGYQARLGLAVKTSSIDKLGDVIAKAGELGIAEVGGFQLMMSDAMTRKVRDECLTEATANARAKAEKMVAAAGGKLGRIRNLNEGYSAPVQPMYANRGMAKMEMAVAADAGMPAPTIQAGSTNMQLTVNATFEVE